MAFEFEQDYAADNRQTFAEYAEYVLKQKELGGAKFRALDRYYELLERISPAIGHMKLTDIRPQHLNSFYDNPGKAGISSKEDKAQARGDFYAVLKDKHMTRTQLALEAGVSATTITAVCPGKKIALKTADAIARALGMKAKALFDICKAEGKLANKTILEHHRLIWTILAPVGRLDFINKGVCVGALWRWNICPNPRSVVSLALGKKDMI